MTDSKILLELEIKGTEREIKDLATLQASIDNLKSELKSLGTQDAELAERKKVQLKGEQDAYRKLQTEVKNQNKAVQDGGKTLAGMRATLLKLNAELEKTEVGTEAFKDLQVETKKLREEINKADESVGRFQGNVGNYKNAVVSAFQAMGINVGKYTGAIDKASMAQKSLTTATGTTTTATKAFRLALISTGIGAIAVAVGALAAAFLSTERGVQAVNRVLIPLRTIFERIKGIVQDISFVIVDAFTNPQQAIKDLWEAIKTNIVNRFTGLIDTFKAFGRVLKGVFTLDLDEIKAGAKEFGESYIQVLTGVDNLVGKVGDGFKKLGQEIKQASKEGSRLADIEVSLKNLAIERAKNENRLRREAAEQRAILDDVNLTLAERQKAGEKYLEIQDKIAEYERREADLQVEKLRLRQKQNDTDLEGQLELAEAESRRDEIEAQRLEGTRRVQNQINNLIKQNTGAEISGALEVDELKEGLSKEEIRRREAEAKAIADYNEFLKQLSYELFETELENIERTFNERIAKITGNSELEIQLREELERRKLLALEAANQQEIELTAKTENAKKQLRNDGLESSLAQLKGAAKEQGKIQRGLFLLEKTAALRTAFIKLQEGLAKNASAVPFPANLPLIIGFLAQTAGVIGAIRSVAAPESPKFAEGVIGLQGAGTSTSDSISAKLSKGESVMTAKATNAFAPLLADMERAVGNEPNYNFGRRRFATGVIGQRQPETTIGTDTRRAIEEAVRQVGSIPVVVSEQDITGTQANVRRIKVTGDL